MDPNATRKDNNISYEILKDRCAARAVVPAAPTRWRGSRIIDYAVTDLDHCRVSEPEQVAHAISDHKIGIIEVTTDKTVNRSIPAYQPPVAYVKPQEGAKEAWRDRIRNHYKKSEGCF